MRRDTQLTSNERTARATGLRSVLAMMVLGLVVLAGCGGGSDADAQGTAGEPDRTIAVTADEYSFAGDPGVIEAGDTISFTVENVGALVHSMQVLDDEGRRLAQTGPIEPGDTAEVTVTFEDSGEYRMICDIDDHLSRGQSAGLTVVDA